jgi:hypothetical protein
VEKRGLKDVSIQNVKAEVKYMDITGDDNERMMKIRQSNVEDLQKDVQIKRKKAKDPL